MSSLPWFPIILDRIKSTFPRSCSKLCLTLGLPAIQSCPGHLCRPHFAGSWTEGAILGLTGSRRRHTRRCADPRQGKTRRYDDNVRHCATFWAAFGGAQSDDDTRWSEAHRGQRRTQLLPERPIAPADAATARHQLALAPHLPKPAGDVDPRNGAGGVPIRGRGNRRAVDAGKQPEDFVRQKPRSRREDVSMTMPVLLRSIKAPRLHEIKVFSRTRHRHVKQPALFVDLLGFAGGHVRRDAAVHEIENKDGVPLLPFGGVDRRQDQIVFVEQRPACLCAARIRRVESQFGQETLATGITEGDLLELVEVSGSGNRIIVKAIEQRLSTPAER